MISGSKKVMKKVKSQCASTFQVSACKCLITSHQPKQFIWATSGLSGREINFSRRKEQQSYTVKWHASTDAYLWPFCNGLRSLLFSSGFLIAIFACLFCQMNFRINSSSFGKKIHWHFYWNSLKIKMKLGLSRSI